MKINVVTVIGANGTLGIGVSSMFASFGNAKVYMLARSLEKAQTAIEKAGLAVKANSIKENMEACTYADMERCLKESDLVIETIVEDFNKKEEIHKQISKYINKNAVCASVTSGISINKLATCYEAEKAKRFIGLHFFNPPYSLQLLELIASEKTDKNMEEELKDYLVKVLHRKVIKTKDEAGFLANRIGFQFINQAMQYAEQYKQEGGIDYIDTILGCFTGRNMSPLHTADFVGLDVHKAIVDNIYENTNDYAHSTFILPNYTNNLIKEGKLGDKTEEGLYKINENKVFDIQTNKYRDIKDYNIPFIDKVIEKFKVADYKEGIQIILQDNSKEAKICREFLINYIIYSIRISNEVAEGIYDCDIAMAEGFNWIPPYALAQVMGEEYIKKILPEDVLKYKIQSKYPYEKFLKAKR